MKLKNEQSTLPSHIKEGDKWCNIRTNSAGAQSIAEHNEEQNIM